MVITESTEIIARNTARDYFARLTPEELVEMDLHPELVKTEGFIDGVLDMTRIMCDLDESLHPKPPSYYVARYVETILLEDQLGL